MDGYGMGGYVQIYNASFSFCYGMKRRMASGEWQGIGGQKIQKKQVNMKRNGEGNAGKIRLKSNYFLWLN
jgi:hypothetical protein